MGWNDNTARSLLRGLFDAGVQAADPAAVLAAHLPIKPTGRCIVVGVGKSAATMAAALEAAWPDVDLRGIVVTRYGHGFATQRIRVLEASHPVPDAASEAGARALMAEVAGLGPDDLVIALISGGGSALAALPGPGLSLADKQAVNASLLRSGAPIGVMNAVRKHLSGIKAGRLAAAAAPARVVTLVISDVPGDDPAVIASGPTVPGAPSRAAVRAMVAQYGVELPPAAAALLAGEANLPPIAGPVDVRMIATPAMALEAAAQAVREAGATPMILGDALEGESRELGTVMAGIARSIRTHGHPAPAPCVLLSGGEATVTIGARKPGRGGRNTEFLLSLAVALQGLPNIWAVAGDTDGIDGTEDAAGAIVTPSTLARATAAGVDPATCLAAHDSYSLFDAVGDLIRTGPTLTNVNDFRAILVT
ncbi:glycerate kinase [Acidisphaera sp. L21]|uniref:glycerate kinase type-2 family protein n=1 Tax=Acidisphaera sp. L21 TaxID=1641851 RepID=UPI00131CD91D|nr:glycerate kinase [Acidisphaera sp. L21]